MSDAFIGEIRPFGFNFAPKNWATCSGQQVPIQQNQALFSILGTTYGGNGVTTFALPDLRGRSPIGQGQGPGLSPYNLGQIGGQETVTLLLTQMPTHTHSFMATTAAGTKKALNLAIFADDVDTEAVDYFALPNAPNSSFFPLNAQSMPPAGLSQAHENMQPYVCVLYCVCMFGIFPSRN